MLLSFPQSELEAIDALMSDLARQQGKGAFFSHLKFTSSSITKIHESFPITIMYALCNYGHYYSTAVFYPFFSCIQSTW